MIGTSLSARGGIASVARLYRQCGLFDRFNIRYIETHGDGSTSEKAVRAARALAAFWRELARRPRLVHIHVASRNSFWRKTPFFLSAFACRVPAILHLHGGEFHRFYADECGPARKRVVRFLFEHSRTVVALSETWASWVRGTFPGTNVEVIPNAVLMPRDSVFWDRRETATILFLGQVSRSKGCIDLLAAVAQLANTRPKLRLILAGEGNLDEAKTEAAERGIDECVDFPGWVESTVKHQLLEQATVFALPSYGEGLPVSVLEAMAVGLPVVATKVGGIPELIRDGLEGFLIEPGDVPALTTALQCLLDDPTQARRMGEAGRLRVAQSYSAETVTSRLAALYAAADADSAASPVHASVE